MGRLDAGLSGSGTTAWPSVGGSEASGRAVRGRSEARQRGALRVRTFLAIRAREVALASGRGVDAGPVGGLAPEAKLRLPELRPGLIRRERFFPSARLSDSPATLVTAPAGYGKTTLLAQWAAADRRPAAFLSLSRGDDDPVALIGWVTRALDGIEPLQPGTITELTAVGADPVEDLVPRLRQVLADRSRPFILMLDNVDRVRTRPSVAVIEMLVTESVGSAYQLVMAGRREPSLEWARWQANGLVERFGVEDLRMNVDEGTELLRSAGLHLDADTAGLVVDKAEGWPGGLYLAALALRDHDDPIEAAQMFAGDDRLVVDYVRSEFLSSVSPKTAAFLLQSAVLDTLSGELCDAVLERSDSVHMLAEIARANLFLIPLDRRGEWYRYHRLLRDVLISELHCQDPEIERRLHAHACEWHERRGELERAIDHANASGDVERAGNLVWAAAPGRLGAGLAGTVGRWLDLFDERQIHQSAALAVTAAWWALTVGDIDAVDRWALVVELMPPDDLLPNGTPVRAAAVLLRALLGTFGLSRMRDDAAEAYALDARQSPYRALALLLEGSALRLLGDEHGARERLEDAARLGKQMAPSAGAQALESARAPGSTDGGLGRRPAAGRCRVADREPTSHRGTADDRHRVRRRCPRPCPLSPSRPRGRGIEEPRFGCSPVWSGSARGRRSKPGS